MRFKGYILFVIFTADSAAIEKTAAIRRIAVQESGVSRHHRGPIYGPPETLQRITAISC